MYAFEDTTRSNYSSVHSWKRIKYQLFVERSIQSETSKIEPSRFFVVIASPQAVNSNLILNNLCHFMFTRICAQETTYSLFHFSLISLNYIKYRICVYSCMSTKKVKIILHLLLMSDLHAFTILDADTRNFRTFITK